MSGPEKEEEVLTPISLEVPSQEPGRSFRWGYATVLVIGLSVFSGGLYWFLSEESETDQETPMPPPAEPTLVKPMESESEDEVPPADGQEDLADPEEGIPLPTFKLQSEPSGASVLRNGVFLGTTPLELSSWEKNETLVLRKAGYQPRQISLPAPLQSAERRVELEMEMASVRLSGDLEDARISVNGQEISLKADGGIELPLRENILRIQKSGFQVWERTVTPTRAYQRDIVVSLTPLEARTSEEKSVQADKLDERVITTSMGLEMILPELPIEVEIGAARGTPGRKSHEGIRRVRLERPFRISKTEISNAQFAQFDAAHSSGRFGSKTLSNPDQPVVNLSWEQAVQFCNWLSEREGLPQAYKQEGDRWSFDPDPGTGYRLPTEAEWEAISRGKTKSNPYAWGDALPPPPSYLNIAGEESSSFLPRVLASYRDSFAGPAAVKQSAVGPFEVQGLAGNVKEWVHDGFTAPDGSNRVVSDPMQESSARFHVIKGASWKDHQWMDLALSRRRYDEAPAVDVGFRVARYVGKKESSRSE